MIMARTGATYQCLLRSGAGKERKRHMSDSRLWLSQTELEWLALALPSEATWPSADHLMPLLAQLPGLDHSVAGGPRLRATVLALMLRGDARPAALDLSLSELWLLDSLMVALDLRGAKLPDGTPLMTLARRVWTALLDQHEEQLPPQARKEERDAKPGGDADTGADAIASAEAILRSRHGEGAGEDLPPAAA